MPVSAVSMAVVHTSPSPCTAWPSPTEKPAPSLNTGKYKVEPGTSSLLSRLPPCARGWMDEIAPQALGGATPMTPKNGRSGISSPQGSRPTLRTGSNRVVICSNASISPGSAPASGRTNV